MKPHRTRLTVALLLVFTLSAGAWGLPLGTPSTPAAGQESFLDALWSRLESLVRHREIHVRPDSRKPDASSLQKEGPKMDPNGHS